MHFENGEQIAYKLGKKWSKGNFSRYGTEPNFCFIEDKTGTVIYIRIRNIRKLGRSAYEFKRNDPIQYRLEVGWTLLPGRFERYAIDGKNCVIIEDDGNRIIVPPEHVRHRKMKETSVNDNPNFTFKRGGG